MPNHQEQELKSLLTEQDFGTTAGESEILENRNKQYERKNSAAQRLSAI